MHRQIFYNGNILTQDKSRPRATAFIAEAGKYLAIGDDREMLQQQNDRTELIDLAQRTILPGFHDAHVHIWKVGNLLTYMLDLRGVTSLAEMLDLIRDYYARNPELEWIQARGFNEALFPDQRMPNRFDLDGITREKPIVVIRTCAHQVIVNTKAMELAGIDRSTQPPAGGEIRLSSDGELLGHFTETAIGLVLNKIPKYSKQELREMVLAAQREFLAVGITAATDPAVDSDLLAVYQEMAAQGDLKIRINAIPIRIPDGGNSINANPELFQHDFLTVNSVKFFADGGLSGKTAALFHPYKNSAERGVLRFDQGFFKHLALESQSAGLRIATHAIGDAAIDMVLKVLHEIANSNRNNLRHRIEHFGLPTRQHLLLMKELAISAVMQPIFIYELGKNFRDALTDEYLERVYPLRSVAAMGINLALSTDAPVVKDFRPMTNIRSAIERKDCHQQAIAGQEVLTIDEAFYAYTMGSAIACGWDQAIGSISVGKWADFNIFRGQPDELKLASTYIAGVKEVHATEKE